MSEFQPLIEAQINDEESKILTGINKFITASQKRFDVRAIYLEMNGFDINYDRWYFDYFAYDNYSADRKDPDWLCEWNSEEWQETTIRFW